MKFTLATDAQTHGTSGSEYVRRYREVVREAVAAEQAGFYAWAPSEVHFSAPSSNISAPDALMGAVAESTERIALRYLSIASPLHNPVAVAERIATIDVISGGRVEFAAGRGNNLEAFKAFGVEASKTRAMWEESMQIVARLLTEERVTFAGEFWSPEDITTYPRPATVAGPGLFSVATGIDSHRAVARLGMGDIAWDGYLGWRYLQECYDTYRAEVSTATDPLGGVINDHFAYYVTAAACSLNREEAIEVVRPRAYNFVDLILRLYSPLAENPSYEYYSELQSVRKYSRDLDFLMSHGPSVVAGTPEDFVKVLNRLDNMGVDEIVLTIDGADHDTNLTTIEMLGKYVLPEFSG